MSETGRCRVNVPEGATLKDGPSARRRHCVYQKLDSDVAVMETAQNRMCDHASSPLNRA